MVVERRGQYTPEQYALSNLPRIVEESVRETEDLRRQFTGFKPGMDLLSWYKRTDRFKSVYGETQSRKRGILKPGEIKRLHRDFAGIIFQDLAYSVCALDCDDSRVLLTPEKSSEFWQMLYRNKRIVFHSFGKQALENTHVPDGILVDRSRATSNSNRFIFKLYEYSLVRMSEKDLEKHLNAIRIQHKRFPRLFAEKYAEIVAPITFPPPKLEGEEDKISFLPLPITRTQFGHFIRDVYDGMR